MKLDQSFYRRDDVLQIGKDLLGKYLFTRLNGDEITGGMIVETEAYMGAVDKAAHSYDNRRTERTEIMYQQGGVAYVYLCYGIHSLFNVITNDKDIPEAVLIRAVKPTHGVGTILERRNKVKLQRNVAGGPGMLTKALGIDTSHDGLDLTGNKIWIEDLDFKVKERNIICSPRVGVDYAEEDAANPWRYRIKGSEWTSPAK
ncbi:MAG TPA: DNA-3-methyladenine glycosylase [Balneolales bacterium]|nr:DNA-3-methyladenine glycosylase [Balneolales bacterium]